MVTYGRLNKTAKEIYDAFMSGTTVLLRGNAGGEYTVRLNSVDKGTGTDANNTEFIVYMFEYIAYGTSSSLYAYGDNYYPVSDGDVAQEEAGWVDSQQV